MKSDNKQEIHFVFLDTPNFVFVFIWILSKYEKEKKGIDKLAKESEFF